MILILQVYQLSTYVEDFKYSLVYSGVLPTEIHFVAVVVDV